MTFDSSAIVEALFRGFFTRNPTFADACEWKRKLDSGYALEKLIVDFINAEEFAFGQGAAKLGLFQPPGHFYSPLFSGTEDEEMFRDPDIVSASSRISGVELSQAAYKVKWEEIAPHISNFAPAARTGGRNRYYTDNPNFGYADAAILHGMICHHQPKRIIEIGSGFSSAVMLDLLMPGVDRQITFIEPYPALLKGLMRPGDENRVQLIDSRLQRVSIETFHCLNDGDFLFIDSSHVAKSGSDVLFEFFEIFPILKPGVFVHVHDVFFPFEYPRAWVVQERRSWNEAYLLRAFLSNNSSYEVVFFWDHFWRLSADEITESFPMMKGSKGGSFWMRKKS